VPHESEQRSVPSPKDAASRVVIPVPSRGDSIVPLGYGARTGSRRQVSGGFRATGIRFGIPERIQVGATVGEVVDLFGAALLALRPFSLMRTAVPELKAGTDPRIMIVGHGWAASGAADSTASAAVRRTVVALVKTLARPPARWHHRKRGGAHTVRRGGEVRPQQPDSSRPGTFAPTPADRCAERWKRWTSVHNLTPMARRCHE